MKTKNLLLLLLALMCLSPGLWAQNFIYSYNTTGIYPGGQTDVVKIIETYDRGYAVLSNGIDGTGNGISAVTKYTKNGQQVFTYVIRFLGPPNSVTGLALAENPYSANHELAVGGRFIDNGVNKGFALQLSQAGGFLGSHIWTGNPCKSLTYSNGPNVLAILFTGLGNTGLPNLTVTKLTVGTSAFIASAVLTDQAIVDAVDIVDMPSKAAYGIVGNRNATFPPGQPLHIVAYEVNYALAIANGLALPVTTPFTNTFATRMIFDNTVSGGQYLYITGYKDGTNRRPILIKLNVMPTPSLTAFTYLNATLSAGTDLYGTGLAMVKKAGQAGLMVSCYSQNGGTSAPYTYTTDLTLTATNFYQPVLPNKRYVDVTNTFDPEMYMVAGRDMLASNLTLSRVNYQADGCGGAPQTPATLSLTPTVTTLITIGPYSYSYTALIFQVLSLASPVGTPVCGCSISSDTRATYWNRTINMSGYTFGSWNKNQTAFNPVTEDAVLGITAVNSGANNILLAHIDPEGIWDFGKTYTTATATHEVRAVKRLGNGDYGVTGISKVTSTGVKNLFVMRVDPNGNVLWYKRIAINNVCGNCYTTWACELVGLRYKHVYITETRDNDIVIAADILLPDKSGAYAVSRISSDGNTLRYFTSWQPYITNYDPDNGRPERQQVELTGLTATRDSGYAICGSSGNDGNDWNGTIVIKFDKNFSGTNTKDWHRVFRKNLSSYKLYPNTKAAYAVANDIKEDAAGNLVVVGFENNMTDDFFNETYTGGLLLVYSSTGTLTSSRTFKVPNAEMVFTGLAITASGDYAVTGKYGGIFGRNNNPLDYRAMFIRISGSALTGKYYGIFAGAGTEKYNELNCVFEKSNGFALTGINIDNSGLTYPTISSVNATGDFQCDNNTINNTAENIANNEPVIYFNSYYTASLVSEAVTTAQVCFNLPNLCTPPPPTSDFVQPQGTGSGSNDFETNGAGTELQEVQNNVVVYPNPASDKVTVDMISTADAKCTINVYDVQGRLVTSKKATFAKGKSSAQVEIAELKTGIYILQVVDSNSATIATQKFEKH